MKALSYSILTLKCPRHILKRLNNDQRDSYVSEETQAGRELHMLVEDYLTSGKGKADLWELLPYGWKTVENMKELLIEAEIEKRIEYDINGVNVKGYIDLFQRTSRGIEIYDLKTSYSPEITSKHKFQLMLYALPFLRENERVDTYIWFLRFGNIQQVHSFTPADMENIERRINRELRRIQKIYDEGKDELAPTPYECMYCEFKRSCPAWNIDEDDHLKIAEKYIALKEKVKELEKILKAEVNEKGPIEVNDYVIGYHPSERTEIDVEGAISYLTEKHPEIAKEVLTINTTKYKKWAKKIDELTSFVAVKLVPKWGIKKKEDKS